MLMRRLKCNLSNTVEITRQHASPCSNRFGQKGGCAARFASDAFKLTTQAAYIEAIIDGALGVKAKL